ncbi:protoporphyrinogen oxidase [Micromonospora musae]|uniref:protoporphyrinogen oxidase n=1 Tax=Micromonospora musae TaxID=1894970 RepID=UPI0033F9519E
MRKRIAVVGGGIAGLSAAVRLQDMTPDGTEIVVYERSAVPGGKLRTGELAGTALERGPDAFLFGGPGGESAAVRLVRRVGLGDELIHPAPSPSALALGGRLISVPGGTLMGIPADPAQVEAVAEVNSSLDRDEGRPLLAPGQDVSVGELVRARYGDQVVDRLVDPMLGGVYAGRADQLSLAVTIPALARTARVEHTLAGAVRAVQSTTARTPGRPVFAAVRGGMRRLVSAALSASGARLHLNAPVQTLEPSVRGWRLVVGPPSDPRADDVDAVILALPAKEAARLLGGVDQHASKAVGALRYADVALVGMALPAGTDLPERSGFLVPAEEETLIKAATFVSRKWPKAGGPEDPVHVRMSIGRAGDQDKLRLGDDYLADRARAELSALIDAPVPVPHDFWVQRWYEGLPQYGPGHLDRIATARAALAVRPGIALAGASFDGVGVPACVTSGEGAADLVVESLMESG